MVDQVDAPRAPAVLGRTSGAEVSAAEERLADSGRLGGGGVYGGDAEKDGSRLGSQPPALGFAAAPGSPRSGVVKVPDAEEGSRVYLRGYVWCVWDG